MMRDQDAQSQLYLYDAAYNAVGGGQIKMDERDVVAVLKGWHVPGFGVVDVGRIGSHANLQFLPPMAQPAVSR
jgi:hypothetical protein